MHAYELTSTRVSNDNNNNNNNYKNNNNNFDDDETLSKCPNVSS